VKAELVQVRKRQLFIAWGNVRQKRLKLEEIYERAVILQERFFL
jgi:hypothetical protein